jgi:hypothetical protein
MWVTKSFFGRGGFMRALHRTLQWFIDFFRRYKMEKMDQHHISCTTQYKHRDDFLHSSGNYCILCILSLYSSTHVRNMSV